MKPLQTHDIKDKQWHPPKSNSPYYSYDVNDTWLEELGLGHYTYTLANLYDVRDWNGRLLGYTRYNPIDCNYSGLMVQASTDVFPTRSIWNAPSIEDHISYKRIKINVCNYAIDNEYFRCWRVSNVEDAIALVKCGWIECLDQDNISRFCCRIYEQHYKDARLNDMFGSIKFMDYPGIINTQS